MNKDSRSLRVTVAGIHLYLQHHRHIDLLAETYQSFCLLLVVHEDFFLCIRIFSFYYCVFRLNFLTWTRVFVCSLEHSLENAPGSTQSRDTSSCVTPWDATSVGMTGATRQSISCMQTVRSVRCSWGRSFLSHSVSCSLWMIKLFAAVLVIIVAHFRHKTCKGLKYVPLGQCK
jgi:hypothetical protein